MNMDGLNQSGYLNSLAGGYQTGKRSPLNKDEKESKTGSAKTGNSKAGSSKEIKRNEVGGRTIGSPKLSDKAMKYYEQLKKKYSNMDFILVSPEMKEEAERKKGTYGGSKELIVLIDSDKVERMAEDEEFRKKYETILSNATSQFAQMKSSLLAKGSSVSTFGMTFDNKGNASFFAVVDKSLALQRERIAAKKEDNARQKKLDVKKVEEKRIKEGTEKKKAEAKAAEKGMETRETKEDDGERITVTADSWEELLNKIDAVVMDFMTDNVLTDSELRVGQNIDFTL